MTQVITAAMVEPHLDWLTVADAIADGHRYPKAKVADVVLQHGDNSLLNRSAWIDGLGLAVKTATIFPGNVASNKPAIAGAVNLFSDADGSLEATLDFALVTKWKTAADSLLAARRLARADSRNILLVGAGTVARTLHAAYRALFPDARFTLWNRSAGAAQAFVTDHPGTVLADDLETAVARADIISCATMAVTPLIRGEWLQPGQHVDLIGAYRADMREVDDTALARAQVFVDSRDTVLDHIGELRIPVASGAFDPGDIRADFYQPDQFRRSDDQAITLCKNGGGAHLDLMVCRHMLQVCQTKDGVP